MRPGGSAGLLGTTIGGRYRLDSILGEGGMGTVYAAEHLLMRKRVALKVLHPDMSRVPDVVARFEREAMAAGHIDHPNIAAATDFGKLEDGSFFLVLELVVGDNLRDVITRGPLETGRAVHIAMQIASALSRAHSLGVVHRDLKPDNVMLITRGADLDFVKVLDFGIAKVPLLEPGAPQAPEPSPLSGSSKVLTQMGMIYGTPDYMSPEQALGQAVDGRADLYALGVLLFEMLTGKRPFQHGNLATLLGLHVAAPVPAMSDVAPTVTVPAPIEAVVRRLMAKDPAQRFATAEELETALATSGAVTLPSEPPPDALAAPPPSPVSAVLASSRARVFLGAGIGAGLLLAISAVLLTRSTPTTTSPDRAPSPSVAPVASSTPPPSPTPASPQPLPPIVPSADLPPDPLAPVILAAEAALARKDTGAVIGAIAPLEAANAGRADIHKLLERAYAMSHERVAALREADAWLALDGDAASDLGLQSDIGEIATRPDTSDAAIALLGSRMGAPGADILYDLGYASQQAPSVARRARVTLAQPQVRAHAGPAAAILLDLRDANTCEKKRALLPRVKTDADKRALPLLTALLAGRQNACLRGDTDLPDAIAAVRGRKAML
jgi:serine/threonine-protein kinase